MSTVLPEVCKYSNNVWCFLGCNPGFFTLQGTNIYLVGSGPKDRILIDSGEGSSPKFVENVRKILREEKVMVNRVILTHWHFDHVGGLEDLIPVFKEANSGELPCVYKFPTADGDESIASLIPREYKFEKLIKGQIFKTEGATLKIYHTPGHTTDHAIAHLLEENALFSGDCLLGEGTGVFEDLFDYMATLEFMLKMKVSRIYSGHGPVIKDPEATINFNLNHQIMREKRVLKFFGNAVGSVSMEEVVKGIYPGITLNTGMAERNVEHHLKKLLREQKIRIVEGGRYLLNPPAFSYPY